VKTPKLIDSANFYYKEQQKYQ